MAPRPLGPSAVRAPGERLPRVACPLDVDLDALRLNAGERLRNQAPQIAVVACVDLGPDQDSDGFHCGADPTSRDRLESHPCDSEKGGTSSVPPPGADRCDPPPLPR